MKHHWAIVPAFALGLTVSASAQKSPEATVVDPKVHNVLFENDHVRVLEARASYQRRPMHSHPLRFHRAGNRAGSRCAWTDATRC